MTSYPNLKAAALHMSWSGAATPTEAWADNALVTAQGTLGEAHMQQAEDEMAAFANEHAFAHQWAGEGQDDDGEEPPISDVLNSTLEVIYSA